MDVALSIIGIIVGASCIWLTVRIANGDREVIELTRCAAVLATQVAIGLCVGAAVYLAAKPLIPAPQ